MKPQTRKKLDPLIEKLGVEFFLSQSTHNRNVIQRQKIEEEVEELRDDKQYLLNILRSSSSSIYPLVSRRLKKDSEFSAEAIKYSPHLLTLCDVDLQYNEDFLLKILKSNPKCGEYITSEVLESPDFQLKAIKITTTILEHAEYELEREVVLKAVKIDGNAIKYDKNYFSDREILFEAMKNTPHVLSHLFLEYTDNREFMVEMIKHASFNYPYASGKLKQNREFLIEVLGIHGAEIMKFLTPKKLKDPEIIELGIENDPTSLNYLPKKMAEDPKVILRCVRNFKSNHQFISKQMLNDKKLEWLFLLYYKWIPEVQNFNVNFCFN
eukprot:gene8629-576_t